MIRVRDTSVVCRLTFEMESLVDIANENSILSSRDAANCSDFLQYFRIYIF